MSVQTEDQHRYREQVRSAEHASLDEFQGHALEMILSPTVRQAFDLSGESEKLKDRYGRHTVGQSALIARRLMEAGSRSVTVVDRYRRGTTGDWDTHDNNDERHRDVLVPVLDQVLSTLLADLAGEVEEIVQMVVHHIPDDIQIHGLITVNEDITEFQ